MSNTDIVWQIIQDGRWEWLCATSCVTLRTTHCIHVQMNGIVCVILMSFLASTSVFTLLSHGRFASASFLRLCIFSAIESFMCSWSVWSLQVSCLRDHHGDQFKRASLRPNEVSTLFSVVASGWIAPASRRNKPPRDGRALPSTTR